MNDSQQFSEENYAETLVQLQQSINTYVGSIQQLLQAIDTNNSLEKKETQKAKKLISSTISTLLELHKVNYKKIEMLIHNWEMSPSHVRSSLILADPKASFLPVKKNGQVHHMKKYHLKKENQYRTIICYEGSQPAPPWKAKSFQK